jgi:hypothetical protein
LKSIVEKGKDITNNKIRFNIATLENARATCTKISFLVDKIEIEES